MSLTQTVVSEIKSRSESGETVSTEIILKSNSVLRNESDTAQKKDNATQAEYVEIPKTNGHCLRDTVLKDIKNTDGEIGESGSESDDNKTTMDSAIETTSDPARTQSEVDQ